MCAVVEYYPAKDGGVKVEAFCVFTRQKNTVHLEDIDYDTFSNAMDKWQYRNSLIQNAFPFLTNAQREFLISGSVPGTYPKHVGEL